MCQFAAARTGASRSSGKQSMANRSNDNPDDVRRHRHRSSRREGGRRSRTRSWLLVHHSIAIMTDGCTNFRKFLIEGTKPNLKKINEYVERSLMLVTALSPVIGYDKASKIAHYAMDNDLSLKEAALKLGFVTAAEFDHVVDPKKMVRPYVAAGAASSGAP